MPYHKDSTMLSPFPAFEDAFLGFSYGPCMPKGMVRETKEVIAIARRFNAEVVRPSAVALDRKTH
jgi:acyl-CoA dehydrogenase